jgi:hypothetical protein
MLSIFSRAYSIVCWLTAAERPVPLFPFGEDVQGMLSRPEILLKAWKC